VKDQYETVIIGGGPAGLNAALVLGRCRRKILLCDTGHYRNKSSQALHCFMSRDGIAPKKLLALARKQLQPYASVQIVEAKVARIERGERGFILTKGGEAVRAQTVLVATGVVDELPAIDGIRSLFGRSVHVCPYCDGWEHRDAPVAAYGKAGQGVGLALLLRQWTHDLVLCTNGPGELEEQDRTKLRARGIDICEERISRLEGEGGCLRNVVFADGRILPRRALFFNTGQHPLQTA